VGSQAETWNQIHLCTDGHAATAAWVAGFIIFCDDCGTPAKEIINP